MTSRRTPIDRLNEARKSSLPTIGRGRPLNSQGNEGDLTFRRTSEGLILYIKANHSWHGVKVGESFSSLESTINDIKSKVDVMRQFKLPSTYSVIGAFTLDASASIKLDAGNGKFFYFNNGDTDDFMRIAVGSNGVTSLTTFDSDGTEGHLSFAPDGKIKFAALDGAADSIQCNVGGNTFASFAAEDGSYSQLRLYENGGESSDDYLEIKCEEHGATTIVTHDTAGSAANLSFDIDGDIYLNSDGHTTIDSHETVVLDARDSAASGTDIIFKKNGTQTGFITNSSLNLKEVASANADTNAYGQIWIKSDTPNNLYFTDDTGQDVQITHDGSLIGAGIILGYTCLKGDGTNISSFEIQNSITVEDDTHKITFKTPPSENVEIVASFFINRSSTDTRITVGLSDADASTGYNAIGQKFEYDYGGLSFSDDEIDDEVLTARWVLGASELASVGSSNTFWIGLGTGGVTKTAYLQYGFRSTHNLMYSPFTIKATALPTTIYDGQ